MPLDDVLKMRDTIRNLIAADLLKRNLTPKYAVVKGTVNHASNKVTVLFNGIVDDADNYVNVNMNTIHPTGDGDLVRILGSGSDQYLDDVITPGRAILNATLLP